jgi:hypothetical protein
MPIDMSPGSFAAITIAVLFWWTVLVPPVLTLLPVAVMHGGLTAPAAATGSLVLGAAIVLTVVSLSLRSDPARAERYATAALLAGVIGGMIGAGALLATRLFG